MSAPSRSVARRAGDDGILDALGPGRAGRARRAVAGRARTGIERRTAVSVGTPRSRWRGLCRGVAWARLEHRALVGIWDGARHWAQAKCRGHRAAGRVERDL